MKCDIYYGDCDLRFALGRTGKRPLVVMGINPSSADNFNSDPTIRKVEEQLSAWKKFDGFIMLNLYPIRAAKPTLIKSFDEKLTELNAKIIKMQLCKFKSTIVWAAWGDAFDKQTYFKNCLKEILSETKNLNLEWNKCESLTNSQNPRHPLGGQPHIITKQSELTGFDIEKYLRRKK